MSQKVNENSNPRASVTSKQEVQPAKITGLSPDDDIGVTSGDTGKPPAPPDPTPAP